MGMTTKQVKTATNRTQICRLCGMTACPTLAITTFGGACASFRKRVPRIPAALLAPHSDDCEAHEMDISTKMCAVPFCGSSKSMRHGMRHLHIHRVNACADGEMTGSGGRYPLLSS